MNLDDLFAKRLAQLRNQKGVSARDMSLSLGQGAGYINNIENKNNLPSILQVLCKYKIVQKNLFKWTELNSVRFYVIRKISTCQ